VSQVTISQSLYVRSRGALRGELAKCLRTARALRHPSRKPGQRKTGSGTWSTSPSGPPTPRIWRCLALGISMMLSSRGSEAGPLNIEVAIVS
jgi:hypothetical protein